eukprot:2321024-Rhodomonas_salina.1
MPLTDRPPVHCPPLGRLRVVAGVPHRAARRRALQKDVHHVSVMREDPRVVVLVGVDVVVRVVVVVAVVAAAAVLGAADARIIKARH